MINMKTYVNNEEVQPAPSIGEVGLETIRNPFQEHLNDKNVGEDLICIFEYDFNHSSLLKVNILKCLIREEENMSSDLKAAPPLRKNSLSAYQHISLQLTKAPLLRRIMKMMKVSK